MSCREVQQWEIERRMMLKILRIRQIVERLCVSLHIRDLIELGSEFEMKPISTLGSIFSYMSCLLCSSSRTTVSVNNHKCNFHFSWTSFTSFFSFFFFSSLLLPSGKLDVTKKSNASEISSRKFFFASEDEFEWNNFCMFVQSEIVSFLGVPFVVFWYFPCALFIFLYFSADFHQYKNREKNDLSFFQSTMTILCLTLLTRTMKKLKNEEFCADSRIRNSCNNWNQTLPSLNIHSTSINLEIEQTVLLLLIFRDDHKKLGRQSWCDAPSFKLITGRKLFLFLNFHENHRSWSEFKQKIFRRNLIQISFQLVHQL